MPEKLEIRRPLPRRRKALATTLEKFAKDISEKYVEAPYTTDFGVMFLPIESLYAEVLRHPGVFETPQRKYRITVTGPTTMSALLNSLQMGFRTLAVTKQSSEVWKILEAVKTEFGKFSDQLEKVDKQLSTAKKSLEDLRSTRTNVMQRRLKDVGTLDTDESQAARHAVGTGFLPRSQILTDSAPRDHGTCRHLMTVTVPCTSTFPGSV